MTPSCQLQTLKAGGAKISAIALKCQSSTSNGLFNHVFIFRGTLAAWIVVAAVRAELRWGRELTKCATHTSTELASATSTHRAAWHPTFFKVITVLTEHKICDIA